MASIPKHIMFVTLAFLLVTYVTAHAQPPKTPIRLYPQRLIQPGSDTRVGFISYSPQYVSSGNRVVFATFVKAGKFPTTNLNCIGGIGTKTILNQTVNFSKPYENQNLTFLWDATPGKHNAWVECDPHHDLGDPDYSNNRSSVEVVVDALKPDLVVVSITTDKDVYEGETANIIVKFKYAATSQMIINRVVGALYHGGSSTPTATKVFTNISPGETFEMYHNVYYPEGQWQSTYTDSFRAKIDVNNEIDEGVESNNEKVRNINVYKK